jgi:hypothetical protein
MSKNLNSRQMINVELAARAGNKKSRKVLKNHIPREEQQNLKIMFNCECSDPNCQERIPLTLQEYDDIHRSTAHFVIKKDHIEPSVEKVHKSSKNLAIVEKYAL